MRRILSLAMCVVIAACGGGGESTTACSSLKIANGDNCEIAGSPVVPIVGLTASGQTFSCTGVVVAPTAILTAAHCVKPPGERIASLIVGTPAGVAQTDNGSITGFAYDRRFATTGGGAAIYDYAVIRIRFNAGVSPLPLVASDTTSVGDQVTVFGYGLDEHGHSFIDRINDGDYSSALQAGYMVVDGFGVSRLTFSASYDRTGQSACPGDSGGPAIVQRNGLPVIAGIVSYGSASSCLSGSFVAFGNVGNPSVLSAIRRLVPEARVF